MRIIGSVPNSVFTITLFQLNNKYLIKLEAGPMEQTYKLSTEMFKSVDDLKQFITESFLEDSRELHNEMFANLKTHIKIYRNQNS